MKLLVRMNIFKGHVASLCYDVEFGITMIIVKAFLSEEHIEESYVSILLQSVCKFLYCAMSIFMWPALFIVMLD